MNQLSDVIAADLLNQELSLRLTMTLIHFAWQGLAIGAVAAAVDFLLNRRAASIRHAVHVSSLALMAGSAVATFLIVEITERKEGRVVVRSGEGTADSTTIDEISAGDGTRHRHVENGFEHGSWEAPYTTNSTSIHEAVVDGLPTIPVAEQRVSPAETSAIAEVAESPTRDLFDIRKVSPYASFCYLFGVALMLVRVAYSSYHSRSWIRRSVCVEDAGLLAILGESASALGLKARPLLAWSEQTAVPVVCGILRPVVLLPVYMMTGLSADQMRVLLTHELAHVRRWDPIVNVLQRFVEAFLFFHPVVWWISHRVSIERENCCDDSVISSGAERIAYADALLRITELFSESRNGSLPSVLTVAVTGNERPSELKRRIVRLIGGPEEERTPAGRGGGVALITLVILGLTAGFMQVSAQQQRNSEAPADTDPIATSESPAEQLDDSHRRASEAKLVALRDSRQLLFDAGDYESLITVGLELIESDEATLDDVLWLAYSYHLDEQWKESRDAFQLALKFFDRELSKLDREIQQVDALANSNRDYSGPAPESRKRYFERQKQSLYERWPTIVLTTGLMELDQLDDPEAAITTLKRGLRYCPTAARDLNELAADAEDALAGENFDPNHKHFREMLYPVSTLRQLATAYERTGNQAAAIETWCRVRLCHILYKVGLGWVDRGHLLGLLDQIPDDQKQEYQRLVQANPGNYQDSEPREIVWKSLVPSNRQSPLQATMLPGMQFTRLGPSHGSMVKLNDGRFLLAYTSGDWRQHRVRLSGSRDGKTWDESWELPQNSIFNTRSPSMAVDDDGTIWLMFLSKRFDLSRHSSNGYQLWVTSSRDGRNWAKIKPVSSDGVEQYQNTVQLTRDRNGRFWVFHLGGYASGETPRALGRWKKIEFNVEKGPSGVDHMHATFDGNGLCHLVFDNFGFGIHYTQSSDMEHWSKPQTITKKVDGSSVSFPQMIVRGDRASLVHQTNSGFWLRHADLNADPPVFGDPEQIADHRVAVNGGRILIDGDVLYVPSGAGYTPAILSTEVENLLAASPSVKATASGPASVRQLADQLAAHINPWKVHAVDEQPTLLVDGHPGFRIVLRNTWKHYIGNPQQVALPRQPQAGEPDNEDWESRYEDWELALFPTHAGKASPELRSRIPWQKSNSQYHTRDVCIGEGHGYVWFTRGTIYYQDSVRTKFGLRGGDDRLQILTDGTTVVEPSAHTAGSCKYLLAQAGDAALPYIDAAVQRLQHSQNELKTWHLIGTLAGIRTDSATEMLITLGNSDISNIRRAAEYALIHGALRKPAKLLYYRMLKNHRYFDHICKAIVDYEWKDALPLLREVQEEASAFREYRVLCETRRAIEDDPVSQTLLDAEKSVRLISRRDREEATNREIERAGKVLVESEDAEAASLIALSIALTRFKGTNEELRAAGRTILRSRPRDSTVAFFRSLPVSMQDDDLSRIAKVQAEVFGTSVAVPRQIAP